MIVRYLASVGPAIANHLWQSTMFVVVMWILTVLLRRNQARVRYALWLAASIKFLIPFSLLVWVGDVLPKLGQVTGTPHPVGYAALETLGKPFSNLDLAKGGSVGHAASVLERLSAAVPMVLAEVWLCGVVLVLLIWFVRWQQVSATLRRASPLVDGPELTILRRLDADARARIGIWVSKDSMEPGIFGIFRPVLIWPERLSEHLEREHVAAIMAHETMHVSRWDNLTAVVHMVVEAMFWFHPMVWWMERRMVEERERACDEAVVQLLGEPGVYAESLLRTCRFCGVADGLRVGHYGSGFEQKGSVDHDHAIGEADVQQEVRAVRGRCCCSCGAGGAWRDAHDSDVWATVARNRAVTDV